VLCAGILAAALPWRSTGTQHSPALSKLAHHGRLSSPLSPSLWFRSSFVRLAPFFVRVRGRGDVVGGPGRWRCRPRWRG
jgi:hypothetical protein